MLDFQAEGRLPTTTTFHHILIVGGADTGRAPMAAALLRRLLIEHGQHSTVGSAGVLGHDGDQPEAEARDTMLHMGLNINDHLARSLTDELVHAAKLLLPIDRGTALVVRARYPEAADRVYSLGELAGIQRDIPDPFRMQIGAWITYAREIEQMLKAGLPRLLALLDESAQSTTATGVPVPVPASLPVSDGPRAEAAERIVRLARTVADMPDVLDWTTARGRIESELTTLAEHQQGPDDLIHAYIGLLRAALTMTPPTPSAGQLAALRSCAEQLHHSISQDDLNKLSVQLGQWATL